MARKPSAKELARRRSEAAKKGAATRERNRRAAARRAKEIAKRRAESARKGWETRRKAIKAKKPKPAKPVSRKPAKKPKATPASRAEAARLGWEKRRERQAIQEEANARIEVAGATGHDGWRLISPGFLSPEEAIKKGLSEMGKALAMYGDTQEQEYYERFRWLKRALYESVDAYDAQELIEAEAIAAGWDEDIAERFSKLS